MNMTEALKGNSYPGRGIVIGKTPDGKNAVIAYFIMGRSVNSRNRVFAINGEGIKTEAFDPAKLVDPSLVIYSPVRVLGDKTIVTNGDQTDTIYDYLNDGKTFEEALESRRYEPDAPNLTPRINGIVDIKDGKLSYKLSILKSDLSCLDCCVRNFFSYSEVADGYGRFIHTYKCDGDPIPSFNGEPVQVEISGTAESFANELWNALNEDNKVSLFVRFIPLNGEAPETVIINKNNK